MSPDIHGDREAAKRRLMFVAGEDFYFLAYTTLVLLSELGADSEGKALVEPIKVAYLADLLSSESDLRLALSSAPLSPAEHARLLLLYDRGVSRRAPLERVLDALVHRGLVTVTRKNGESERAHLMSAAAIASFVKGSAYDGERLRVRELRGHLSHLRTMKLETMKARLFGQHGVRTWVE